MENKNNNEPVISDSEMKMPEESFGNTTEHEEEPSYLGMVLAGLIVILILLLVGLYLWGSTLKNSDSEVNTPVATRPTAEENNEPESTKAEAEVETMQVMSNSDELSAIEADLESTELNSLDTELNTIEAELEASNQ